MILRDARPEERAGLEALQRRASLMWDNDRPYLLANPDVIELPLAHISAGRVRVAEEAGAVLGFAVLLPRENVADLDGLFVEPDRWCRGVGRALVEDAAARTCAAGMVALEVVSAANAQGFYEKLGFAVCGMAQTQFGPAKRLRRGLNPGQ
jgi:GNAT superfamily N-acetyltransferase